MQGVHHRPQRDQRRQPYGHFAQDGAAPVHLTHVGLGQHRDDADHADDEEHHRVLLALHRRRFAAGQPVRVEDVLGDGFVFGAHVQHQPAEHKQLNREKQKRRAEQHQQKQRVGAGVEGEDVRQLNVFAALGKVVLPHGLVHLAAVFLNGLEKPLERRGGKLLKPRVQAVEIQIQLLKARALPRQLRAGAGNVAGAIQLAAVFVFQEEQMDVSVIVRQHALPLVPREFADHDHQPDQPAPRPAAGEGNRFGHQPETQRAVNRHIPHAGGQRVQNAPQRGLVARQPRELAVGGIQNVRPDYKQHADEVQREALRIKKPAAREADGHGKQRDHVGRPAKAHEQPRPQVAQGLCEDAVKEFLGVLGLVGGADIRAHPPPFAFKRHAVFPPSQAAKARPHNSMRAPPSCRQTQFPRRCCPR